MQVANLRLQLRELQQTCLELERERTQLLRSATAMEQQLDTLQQTLTPQITSYQKASCLI